MIPTEHNFSQKTIKHSISFQGVGLHNGKITTVVLKPAPANTGIVFVRTDVKENNEIPALAGNVIQTTLATTIGNGNVQVSTIEHMLAALFALGINNLYLEIDNDEMPILDGCSSRYLMILDSAQTTIQNELKKVLFVKKTITVENESSKITIEPYPELIINLTIDNYDTSALNNLPKTIDYQFTKSSFIHDISRSRTFGFLRQIEALQARGLALGGSLENAIVVDDNRIINEEGLRYDDELVKHKLIDILGDLYLTGSIVMGKITAYKPGHAINNMLANKILDYKNEPEYVCYL